MSNNKILKSIEYFWCNLTSQIIIYILIALFAAWQVVSLNYHNFLLLTCENMTKEIVKSNKGDLSNSDKLNSLINKYGISWIVTVNNQNKLTHQYLAVPNKIIQLNSHDSSKIIITRHEKYIDTVDKLGNNYIHIGYYLNELPSLSTMFQPYLVRINILSLFAIVCLGIFLFCATLLIAMPITLCIKHYSPTAKPNEFIQAVQDITLGFCAYELKLLNDFLKTSKQQLDELSSLAAQDNTRNMRFLEIEKSKLERQFQNEMTELKMKVADLEYHHNINEFVKSLADEITASKSLTKAGYKFVSSLRNLFLDNFLFSVMVTNRDNQFKILSTTGFDGQSMQQLTRLAFNLVFGTIIKTGKDILVIDANEFSAYGINHVSQWTNFVRAYCIPIYFQNEPIGQIKCFLSANDKVLSRFTVKGASHNTNS